MKFKIISLGCPKNLVESEFIAHRLISAGHEMADDAPTVVINTCAFIADATRESVETILSEAMQREGKGGRVIVTGCLVERYGEKLSELLPEVGLFVGRNMYPGIERLMEKRGFYQREGDFQETFPRKPLTPPPTAYLKIQEGCDNRCAYCTIPAIRGGLRSRRAEEIREEFLWLLSEGYREINIIGQDITSYGRDQGNNLVSLLKTLTEEEGEFYVRLLYLHPRWITRELIEFIAAEKSIIPYMDIPIQHSEDSILSAMGRGYSKKELESLLSLVRDAIPNVTLRTSLIVGFPGESEEDFEALCRFIQEWEFDQLGVFMYSKEEGTRAAKLRGHLRKGVKRERYRRIMEIQNRISKKRLERLIGSQTKVIVEEKGDRYNTGRILAQAPDIDGIAFVRGECLPGEIKDGKIVKSLDYDVIVDVQKERGIQKAQG